MTPALYRDAKQTDSHARILVSPNATELREALRRVRREYGSRAVIDVERETGRAVAMTPTRSDGHRAWNVHGYVAAAS